MPSPNPFPNPNPTIITIDQHEAMLLEAQTLKARFLGDKITKEEYEEGLADLGLTLAQAEALTPKPLLKPIPAPTTPPAEKLSKADALLAQAPSGQVAKAMGKGKKLKGLSLGKPNSPTPFMPLTGADLKTFVEVLKGTSTSTGPVAPTTTPLATQKALVSLIKAKGEGKTKASGVELYDAEIGPLNWPPSPWLNAGELVTAPPTATPKPSAKPKGKLKALPMPPAVADVLTTTIGPQAVLAEYVPQKPKNPASKQGKRQKYQCAQCGLSVWGKPGLKGLVCTHMGTPFEKGPPFAIQSKGTPS